MKPALVPAAEVARQGYEGLMAGKRVVVPGVINKALVLASASRRARCCFRARLRAKGR